ncbi:MAG: hypothetical protein R3F61_04125 [Myxococcota bacterium]
MIAVLASLALAGPIEDAQRVELDRARAEIAGEVHLSAFDLIDELVYGWKTDPVFESSTPVVLAGVSVPVGLGTGMQALVENHIAAVLAENPTSNVQLVHCPSCTAVVVHSGPEGTVVSRGIDNPAVLAELGGATGKHALFVDLEAEGSWLVLRARITQLTPDLPIVWSHTLATSAATPALLRASDQLKSADEARAEYLAALRSRGPLVIPVRLSVRTYARPDGGNGTPPPPFLWLQTGAELAPTDARAWTSSLMIGGAFIPQAYQGLMGQARVSRLLTGRVRSVTRPDLYGFVGASVMTVWGPATSSFQVDPLNADDIVAAVQGDGPRSTWGTLQLGLDLRIGNRIGVGTFLETLPALRRSQNMGDYIRVLGIGFQGFGTEVTACF